MNAVERVIEYTKLTPEKAPIVADNRPPQGWPSQGVITAKNLVVKYREDLDPVLKGINFSTRPHEKIGIVGRTGESADIVLAVAAMFAQFDTASICVPWTCLTV